MMKNDHLKHDELIKIISKCRSIVTHFNHSAKSSYKLIDIQNQMGLETLKLKQDVPTRWNATLFMLERLVKVKIPLSATLPLIQSPVPSLNASEWDIIDDCIALLQPIEKMSTFLCGEAYPTLSSVIPLVRGLQSVLIKKNPQTDAGKHLKSSLIEVIDKRLNVYENNRTSAKATFLDPRFKKKAFGVESNAQNAQKWVIEELTKLQPESRQPHTQSLPPQPEPRQSEEDNLWETFEKKVAELTTFQTPTSSATILINQYIELPYLDRKANPLQFWEERKHIFPSLYKLAQMYLCIPATSVPSERLFSKAGMVANERRNRLLPKKLDSILFLNSWSKPTVPNSMSRQIYNKSIAMSAMIVLYHINLHRMKEKNGVDLNEMLENNMPDLDTSYLDISKMEIVYDFPNISFDTSKSQEPSLTDSILDDGDSVQLSGAIEITDNIGRMMVENGTNHAPDDLNSFHIVPHLEMEEHESMQDDDPLITGKSK
ncbi:E3 SUMO-protein ligase ZBED1-like [Homalodisca vitripennis]|uniref:E3 SUMO-protein ligase ZBED1-like n=1 Tax=Homalodisca vitripennis TaxID=197043 RepID=UPI001EEC374D|nr:E3 SUMO-protein ligase ZBED1-like [Homalodisca vitripennis]